MSTGQRQRVKLAQAIAHDPSLVVLDEPTDGLDPVQRDEMLGLIRRIGSEFGIDMLLSSHRLVEVEQVCDNVVIIGDGIVKRSGALSDLSGADLGYIVSVDDKSDELAAQLRTAGYDVNITIDGDVLVNGDQAALAVRNVVATLGVGIRRFETRRVTLEDVYLAEASETGAA